MRKILIMLPVCLSMLSGLATTPLLRAITAQAHSIAPIVVQQGKPHYFLPKGTHRPNLGSGNLQYHTGGPIQQNPKVYVTY